MVILKSAHQLDNKTILFHQDVGLYLLKAKCGGCLVPWPQYLASVIRLGSRGHPNQLNPRAGPGGKPYRN